MLIDTIDGKNIMERIEEIEEYLSKCEDLEEKEIIFTIYEQYYCKEIIPYYCRLAYDLIIHEQDNQSILNYFYKLQNAYYYHSNELDIALLYSHAVCFCVYNISLEINEEIVKDLKKIYKRSNHQEIYLDLLMVLFTYYHESSYTYKETRKELLGLLKLKDES